jgi:hypothetical protein
LGARLWPGGELYFNPEQYQGFGLGNTHGIAAFPNAATSKVGQQEITKDLGAFLRASWRDGDT